MKTITLQIGNSDDKLTQAHWSKFVFEIGDYISRYAETVHFFGISAGDARWQNAAWVFVCKPEIVEILKENITNTRRAFLQDSVAWTEGETEFV
jgi:hypothetical protein